MILLYSLFFGAGVAGFVYTKMQRRLGAGNTQSLVAVVGVSFVVATIVFYTVLATFPTNN